MRTLMKTNEEAKKYTTKMANEDFFFIFLAVTTFRAYCLWKL